MDIVRILLNFVIYGLLGGAISWYYYHRRGKDLLGGFWGGAAVGGIGAVIADWLSSGWFIDLVHFLMLPKIGSTYYFTVNLIAAAMGAFLLVWTLNRINHDRDRR